MWHDFIAALALLLVFEGILPFLSPETTKKYLLTIVQINPQSLRMIGLLSMISGAALLYLLR